MKRIALVIALVMLVGCAGLGKPNLEKTAGQSGVADKSTGDRLTAAEFTAVTHTADTAYANAATNATDITTLQGYWAVIHAINGLVACDGAGTCTAATPGTDYQAAITFGAGTEVALGVAPDAAGGLQSVLAEGAFVAGDKTKLDGIESGADVTDAANVAAAGAEMAADMPTDVPANETDPVASVHPWVTATVYAQNALVSDTGIIYKCIVAHTSGDTDDEPGVGATWATYWAAGGTGFDPASPTEIGGTTPAAATFTQINIVRSGTSGDAWAFREGSNNGDNKTTIKGADAQDQDNTIVLYNKDGYDRLGPPFIHPTRSSDYNAMGQYASWDLIPFSGTNTAINLDPVASISTASYIKFLSIDAETKTINPNANDKICYDATGTWTCLDDGDAISITDVGYLELFRLQDGTGWGVYSTNLTISDAGAGCAGWNCGIATDGNAISWYKFDNGALTTDSKGSNTLTSNGTPVADTVNYIQGDASVDLEADDHDWFSRSGTADDFGWASSSALSITGWFKAESSTASNQIFIKTGTKKVLRLSYTSTSYLSIGVDGDDNGTWETYQYGSACTDTQWYFFAITINASTGAYTEYIWDQTAGATLGTPISSTLTNGIANLSSTDDWYIGNTSGFNFDGLLDDMTFWDKVLNQTEIDQIRAGTYGQ